MKKIERRKKQQNVKQAKNETDTKREKQGEEKTSFPSLLLKISRKKCHRAQKCDGSLQLLGPLKRRRKRQRLKRGTAEATNFTLGLILVARYPFRLKWHPTDVDFYLPSPLKGSFEIFVSSQSRTFVNNALSRSDWGKFF